MDAVYGVAYILLLSALMLPFSAFMYGAYMRSRRKVFSPPATALVLVAASVLGIATTVRLFPKDSSRDNIHLFFLWSFGIPLLLSVAVTTVAVLALPTRNARVFGARRTAFPFASVGQALVGLAGLVTLGTIVAAFRYDVEWAQIQRVLTLALGFLLPIGLYSIHLQRRLQAPPLAEVLKTDTRPPVLYLRAFNQESQFFVIGRKSRYDTYASGLAARLATDEQNVGVSFEEYFAGDLDQSIGPFVALGSPEDYISPEGATRAYATDADWMERLRELATKAVCIVVEAGDSANLRREFEYVRGARLHQKLFVITRPKPPEGTKLAYAFYRLIWRVKGIKTITWKEFADELGKVGYQFDRDEPGPGAVVSFDQDGKSVLLATEAELPPDYVAPIARALQ